MKKEQLERMKVGDCFAKKCRSRLTIYRIKQLDEYFEFKTDAMIFSGEGIKTLENVPMNALYSDGFVPIDSAEFDRMWMILSMTEHSIAPLIRSIEDKIEQTKHK